MSDAATELDLIKLAEEAEYLQAHDDLAAYGRMQLRMDPAKHHMLLIEALESVERGELDVLMVMMPPGSAKSSYGSVVFPAWYLGRNPGKNIIAASHTKELADRFGRKVRNTVMSREHTRTFKGSEISEDNASAGRWSLKRGGEYYAVGVAGGIAGFRADLAIIDDPLKNREDADSETIREKQWAWWRDDLTPRLKPGAAVIMIMTRWHEDDIGGRLIDDLKGSGKRVRIIKIPMEAMENDPLGRHVGDPLWPEWFTPQMIADAKKEPRTWSALYQQEPRPIGGGEFQSGWLLYWQRHPSATNRVLLVDPSSGKSKTRGDFTSMWVVGCGPDGNYYVLDGIRDRLNLTGRTEAVFDFVRRYKPAAVGYEQYGLQADIEHIRGEQERQQYRFRIIELGGAMKKEDRIRRLVPLFQQGRVWMPYSLMKTMSAGHQEDVMTGFRNEYASFPVGAHDDAMDCLARVEEPEIRKLLTTPQQGIALPTVGFGVLDSGIGY